jgi:hypothetical protein
MPHWGYSHWTSARANPFAFRGPVIDWKILPFRIRCRHRHGTTVDGREYQAPFKFYGAISKTDDEPRARRADTPRKGR